MDGDSGYDFRGSRRWEKHKLVRGNFRPIGAAKGKSRKLEILNWVKLLAAAFLLWAGILGKVTWWVVVPVILLAMG